jgi:F-type H+-transporting ATPase subunit c
MDPVSAKLIGAGIACIGMGGAGVGVGIIFGNFLQGALRNPSEAPKQFGNLIFGFAVTEALGIFSLLIALLLLFVDGVGGSPTAAERAAAREQASITQTLAEVPSAPVE